MGKKHYNYTKIISILCLAIVLVNIISLTLAYFTDKAVAEDIIYTTGTVDIDAKVLENNNPSDSFIFTSANVMTWETIDRTIELSTTDSESCVVRMNVKFELMWDDTNWNNVSNENFLILSLKGDNSGNWTPDNGTSEVIEDKTMTYHKYYYYDYILSGTKSISIDISMSIGEKFSTEGLTNYFTTMQKTSGEPTDVDYAINNLKYKISLEVEALQFANNAYKADWEEELPNGWAPIQNIV